MNIEEILEDRKKAYPQFGDCEVIEWLLEECERLTAPVVFNDLGMYAVADPNYPQVKVGDLTICRQDSKNVWIQHESGEGAAFPDTLFGPALLGFYNKHF
jgi:hypothetical protein